MPIPLTLGFELADYMISRAFSPNNEASLNRTFIYNLFYAVHAYVHTSDHIMFALAGGAGGAAGGTQLGHTIVAALPKLKKEPVAENQPETTSIERPTPAGLRRRSPGR
jgi:hypothetical protein